MKIQWTILLALPMFSYTSPCHGYPIEELKFEAQASHNLIVGRIEKSTVKGRGQIGDHEFDGRVEQEIVILDVLKGDLKKKQRVVVSKEISSYPIDASRELARAPRLGGTYILRVEYSKGDGNPLPWAGWQQFNARELKKDFEKDFYYLDLKTALARISGSPMTYRKKGPLMSQDKAEQIARTRIKVDSAILSGDEWIVSGNNMSVYIDAETGEVIQQIVADVRPESGK